MLKPALRLLWRDSATIQLGVDPRHAVVLDGVTPAATGVLDLLDGTRDWPAVVAAAERRGIPPADAHALLRLLAEAGALDDAAADPQGLGGATADRLAPDLAGLSLLVPEPGGALGLLARRRRSVALVVGAGRVGGLLAALLAAAGLRRVLVRDEERVTPADAMPGGARPADAGRGRAAAVADAALRAVGGEELPRPEALVDGAGRPPDPADCALADIAIVASDAGAPPPPALLALFAGVRLRYLVVGVRETTGVVGPLVAPGETSCPRCHDLARADRDPGWPALVAQLTTPAAGPAACDVVLAAAVAALGAGQALAELAGPAPPTCRDATLELRLPEWSLRRRTWQPHPDCGCLATGVRRTG